MRTVLHLWLALVLCAPCLVVGARARAQEDEVDTVARAETLFREGRAAAVAGDARTACAKLRASHALQAAPGTLLNIALCERALGEVQSARNHLQEVLRWLPPGDDRIPIAQQHLQALEPPAAAPSLVPPPPAVQPHTTVQPAPAAATASVDARPPVAAYVLLGIGAASLVASGVTGALALDRLDTVNAQCDRTTVTCETDAGVSAAREGQLFYVTSLVTLGVALVSAGAGTYLLLDAPEPGSLALRAGGRF